MTAPHVALLLLYACGMAAGQVLFKYAALSAAGGGMSGLRALLGLAANPFFLAALAVYFGLSLMWTWILTFIPLSRAYPFAAAAFVITPIAAALIFAEPVGPRFAIGILLIAIGLALVVQR